MKRIFFTTLSFVMIFLGIFFLANSRLSLTGAALGDPKASSDISSFLGLGFLGVGMVAHFGAYRDDNETKYFSKRVYEIFDKKYDRTDVWVSRFELDGLMNYIKNAKDSKGRLIFKLHKFEHGIDAPTKHFYENDKKLNNQQINKIEKSEENYIRGSPRILHMNFEVRYRDRYGTEQDVKRHLLITDNPYDSRLKCIGVDEKGKRIESKIYHPKHPRSKNKVYKRKIIITTEPHENE